MKKNLLITSLFLACSLPKAFGTPVSIGTLELTESNGTITAVYNGIPLSIQLTGPTDGWTIELPSFLHLSAPSLLVNLGEPENANLKNEVIVGTQPTFLTWTSDIPKSQSDGSLNSTFTVPNAGSNTKTFEDFTLVLVDKDDNHGNSVPDQGSTGLMLLGVGGLLILGRSSSRQRTAGIQRLG